VRRGLALVLLLIAAPARAENARTSSLSWVRLPGAESCVATQALARAVEERLGRETFVSAAQADVSVEGRIDKKPRGWHAVLTVRDAQGQLLGTREIDRPDASCDAMTQPVALVIAVMIDPDAESRPKPPPPLPPPAAPPAPEVKVIVQREEVLVPAPPEKPLFRFEGSAALMGSAGYLPNVGVGLGAVGMIEPRAAIPFIGMGSYWFDSTASAEQGASTSFQLLLLGSGFCPLWHHARNGRGHLYGCGVGHLGLMRVHSSGFATSAGNDMRVVLDGGLEARATVLVVKPFVLRFGASGVIPLIRDTFTYNRADGTQARIFRMAPVAGLMDVGLGMELP
jgi:hypothetical protein